MAEPETTVPRRVLPVLVLAQLAGTSPWFAVNAVMPDLQAGFGWPVAAVGTLTAAVQLGFIAGALGFAVLSIADRFPARRVFLLSALASALCSEAAVLSARGLSGVRLSCQILCDHDMTVRAISRLEGSGRADVGGKPEPFIEPPAEY